jgi:hypothetical protein
LAPDSGFSSWEAPGAGTASGQGTFAQGMNAAGAIVGSYVDATSAYHGYWRAKRGRFIEFDAPPDSSYLLPLSINPDKAITGFYEDSSHLAHAFLRAYDGTLTTFDVPGAVATYAQSINACGAIVGYYLDTSFHGFLRTPDGTITTSDPPGSIHTEALSINSVGAITGFYEDTHSVSHGFLRTAE